MRHYNNALSLFNRTPFRPLHFFDAFENLEKEFFSGQESKWISSGINYEMKLNSEKSQWELTLELAGVLKDKLKLDVKEGLLSVTAEKTKGLNTGQIEQNFKLPEGIDTEKIEADFTDGILFLTLPLNEKKMAKRIELK